MKALTLLKKYREIFLDVIKEEHEDFDEIGIGFVNQFDEAIAELEALQSRNCEGCYWWSTSAYKCIDHKNELAGTDGYCCNRYETKEQ